jgi:hypothetical protein
MFGILKAMMVAVLHNPKFSVEEKEKESASLNRKSGGMLFGSSHIPSGLPNQRQRRKRAAQMR